MFEQVLLDKIDTYLKTDHEHGMTLKGLTNVSPRDLTATLGDGNPIFSKTEVSKIINLLAKFDLSLKDMATHCYNSRGERVTDSNLDYEINEYAAPEIESQQKKLGKITRLRTKTLAYPIGVKSIALGTDSLYN